MARQRDVIGERYYQSHSRRWYREIGMHKYRFTWYLNSNGSVSVMAEVAVKYRDWDMVHNIRLT